MRKRLSLGLLVAAVGLGCGSRTPPAAAPAAPAPPATSAAVPVPAKGPDGWLTTLDQGHPLVGKIYDTANVRLRDERWLFAAVDQADFILLGEQHDNPDHHRLQAKLVAAVVHAGLRPTVALEMLEPDDDAIVSRYRAEPGATAAGLGPALAWEKSGWPPWAEYQPIADVAFQAGLPLVSANLPRALVRSIAHEGVLALPPGDVARLGLDQPLAPATESALEDELRGSHCGQLPEKMVAPMALAQRARDGQMASRMLSFQGKVFLVAGAGHARTDRGVPARLRAARPDAKILSIGFVEVDASKTTPDSYAARFGAVRLPFDFVWFTPRAKDDDPCAGFHIHHP
jgi:uncharacterized iron-regulated protein